jgi:hypothetical protein
MTETNYFVTTIIGHDIPGRLAGDFMVALPEVAGVAQVEEPSLKPIILPQLRWPLQHSILIYLLLIWGIE